MYEFGIKMSPIQNNSKIIWYLNDFNIKRGIINPIIKTFQYNYMLNNAFNIEMKNFCFCRTAPTARTRTTARPSPVRTTSSTVRRAVRKKLRNASIRADFATEYQIVKTELMNWRLAVSLKKSIMLILYLFLSFSFFLVLWTI